MELGVMEDNPVAVNGEYGGAHGRPGPDHVPGVWFDEPLTYQPEPPLEFDAMVSGAATRMQADLRYGACWGPMAQAASGEPLVDLVGES